MDIEQRGYTLVNGYKDIFEILCRLEKLSDNLES